VRKRTFQSAISSYVYVGSTRGGRHRQQSRLAAKNEMAICNDGLLSDATKLFFIPDSCLL
jgi:hypothetical protein